MVLLCRLISSRPNYKFCFIKEGLVKKISFDRKAFFWSLIGFNVGMIFMLLMIG